MKRRFCALSSDLDLLRAIGPRQICVGQNRSPRQRKTGRCEPQSETMRARGYERRHYEPTEYVRFASQCSILPLECPLLEEREFITVGALHRRFKTTLLTDYSGI